MLEIPKISLVDWSLKSLVSVDMLIISSHSFFLTFFSRFLASYFECFLIGEDLSPNWVQSSCMIKCIGVHNSIQKTLFFSWYQSIRLAFLLELKSVRGLHCLFIESPSLLFSFVWPSSPNSVISLFFCQDVRSSRDCPTPVAAATPFHK